MDDANNTITDCIFSNNTSIYGGSIYVYFPGNLTISNCKFFNNFANIGSALYFEQTGNKIIFYYFIIIISF